MKEKKKTSERLTAKATDVKKGSQVSSGNRFYSAQDNEREAESLKETQRAWRWHRMSETPGRTHSAAAVEPSQIPGHM